MKSEKSLIGIGILTSISASLCCIMPFLTLVAGTSGVLATFSWLEPFRPYLTGITVLTLGFVWYQKLKSKKEKDCECAPNKKSKFTQSKKKLTIITLFAAVVLAFPHYSSIFYTHVNREIIIADKANLKTTEFKISGMTCANCEKHVYQEVQKLSGIINLKASYKSENAVVMFNKTKTTKTKIVKAIEAAGYTITKKIDH